MVHQQREDQRGNQSGSAVGWLANRFGDRANGQGRLLVTPRDLTANRDTLSLCSWGHDCTFDVHFPSAGLWVPGGDKQRHRTPARPNCELMVTPVHTKHFLLSEDTRDLLSIRRRPHNKARPDSRNPNEAPPLNKRTKR
ncbi:unnamed protein product [Arctogadus glacialis]